jgi:hypothetical protein
VASVSKARLESLEMTACGTNLRCHDRRDVSAVGMKSEGAVDGVGTAALDPLRTPLEEI